MYTTIKQTGSRGSKRLHPNMHRPQAVLVLCGQVRGGYGNIYNHAPTRHLVVIYRTNTAPGNNVLPTAGRGAGSKTSRLEASS
jgi:hypothetical protein